MEVYVGVTVSVVATNERSGARIEALQAENLHLRQLVGELLLKNQRLRDDGLQHSMAMELPKGSA